MFPFWRRIGQEFAIRIHKWGVPPNICHALFHLHLYPGHSEPAEVAAAVYMPRQTMTFTLDSMEKNGLAVRKPHPKDRRRKIIRLTPKGHKLAESVFRDLLKLENSAIKTIKGADARAFRVFMNRYADALSAENERDLRTRKE
ncbi:MAG: winged helix-turn-helix transcriptional regulator [Lentisphaerae bacterium]|nr:winged helix-turn-helix transcriptional regulator [Lentisphaerota bacterium]